ncbi:MAG: glycosyltransferase family 2 protein, partial [Actinomycetes bacterium]
MSEARPARFDMVVPTTGRPSLARLLDSLADSAGELPGRVFVVDDRRDEVGPLRCDAPAGVGSRVRVLRCGRGPAAARNAGWRASAAAWVVFVDDDVVLPGDWLIRLAHDIATATPDVAGVQARIRVPLPAGRRPTDWERNVAGLERARWASADIAYRRSDLVRVGGFDERFPRA